MQYLITDINSLDKTFEIKIKIEAISTAKVELKLPEWRPGRYCLQHFAKNIIQFTAFTEKEQHLDYQKTNHFTWEIDCAQNHTIWVAYTYYANQLDGGGCFLSENLIYINFICCAMAVVGREAEPCWINLETNWPTATSLANKNGVLEAKNYDQLVDSPVIASPNLQKIQFSVLECNIYCWFYGKVNLNIEAIKDGFSSFIVEQTKLFGELPIQAYHFLFLILPYRFYHGVEHENSTVIVLGPESEFDSTELQTEFMGVSSHEFFHLWNVKRLRPKELLPYDYCRAQHFPTGFVIEGITTYYGDLMLARSGYFDFDGLAKEINARFLKHFDNPGRFNSSLYDSSIDLWIDGYSQKVPQKGVSIYHKGMITAMILDLEIRRINKNASLDDVMRHLWENFVDSGYRIEDFFESVSFIAGANLSKLLSVLYLSTEPLEGYLQKALEVIGCKMVSDFSANPLQTVFGAKVSLDRFGAWQVSVIQPHSPASAVLSVGDVLHSFQQVKLDEDSNLEAILQLQNNTLTMTIIRDFEAKEVCLTSSDSQVRYFPIYRIERSDESDWEARNEFIRWCGLDFGSGKKIV